MSVSLTTWHGKPALEIADAAGEVFRYTFRVLPGPSWAVELAKVDPDSDEPGAPYAVREGTPWLCNCPDFHYRRRRTDGSDCKHTTAAKELRSLLASLAGVAS